MEPTSFLPSLFPLLITLLLLRTLIPAALSVLHQSQEPVSSPKPESSDTVAVPESETRTIATPSTTNNTTPCPTKFTSSFVANVADVVPDVLGSRDNLVIPTPAPEVGVAAAVPRDSLQVGHLIWKCLVDGPKISFPTRKTVDTLLDTGAAVVLIRDDLVDELGLRRRRLKSKFNGSLTTGNHRFSCSEWVKLKLTSTDNAWTSRTVSAIVAPELAYPMILGGPFLANNDIRIDYNPICVTTRKSGYQLLPPPVPPPPASALPVPATPVAVPDVRELMKQVLEELVVRTARQRQLYVTSTQPDHFHETLSNRLAILAVWDDLSKHDTELRREFLDCFPSDIPHTNRLPTDVYHRFRLKDPEKLVRCRSYSCPKKYKDAWRQLLEQHVQAGRIRESSSEYCSPAFLIPKADTSALPRWVNDYRQLNNNTVPNHYPLPRVQDILADCAKGSIWAKIDMTNAFFQTRIHPDDVKYTAVMTPLGLYEWLVMPMGCRNAPATHQ